MDRLPPGASLCRIGRRRAALTGFMEAIEEAQALDRHSVRDRATRQFDSDRIVDSIITAVNKARLGGGFATTASV